MGLEEFLKTLDECQAKVLEKLTGGQLLQGTLFNLSESLDKKVVLSVLDTLETAARIVLVCITVIKATLIIADHTKT